MANNSMKLRNGKTLMLYRTHTANASLSATEYLPPSQFKVGINNTEPVFSDTDLVNAIPISNGYIIDECDGTFSGSGGGSDSTDNTDTYKEGAGSTDTTSQNLIGNTSNVVKYWESSVGTIVSTRPVGLWFYIKDEATYAKLVDGASYCLRLIFYSGYYLDYDKADLSIGWNWLNSGTLTVGELPAYSGGITNTVEIWLYTDTSTSFAAGELIIDLIRQWEPSDLLKDFAADYPQIDYVNNEVTTKCLLLETEANGFLLNGFAEFNKDDTPLMLGEDTYTGESKSSTDSFTYTIKDRLL